MEDGQRGLDRLNRDLGFNTRPPLSSAVPVDGHPDERMLSLGGLYVVGGHLVFQTGRGLLRYEGGKPSLIRSVDVTLTDLTGETSPRATDVEILSPDGPQHASTQKLPDYVVSRLPAFCQVPAPAEHQPGPDAAPATREPSSRPSASDSDSSASRAPAVDPAPTEAPSNGTTDAGSGR
jgi:hypothetical protein